MASSVIGAIFQALVWWFLFYVGLAHMFVYWNWNATDGSLPTPVQQQLPTTDNPPVLIDKESVDDPVEPEPQEEEGEEETEQEQQEPEPQFYLIGGVQMDEEEVQQLLAETPLEPIALIDLNDEPIPEEVQPLEDNRDKLRQQLESVEMQMAEYQDEAEWLRAQETALNTAIKEIQERVQALESLLESSDDDDQTATDSTDSTLNASSIPIWQTIEDKTKHWNQNMPELDTGSKPSPAAPLLAQALTELTDLSQLETVDDVKNHFANLIQMLDEHNKLDTEVRWQDMTRVLNQQLHSYPTKTITQPTCPAALVMPPELEAEEDDDDDPIEQDEDDEDDDDEDRPTKEDVMEAIDELRNIWHAAYEEDQIAPLVLPNSQERLVAFRDALLEEWANQAKEHVEQALSTYQQEIRKLERQERLQQQQQRDGSSACMQLDQAEGILKLGLLALERQEDLNQAILQGLSQQGWDTDQIILDAVLDDDDGGSDGNQARVRQAIASNELHYTWRQVLDRPFAKTVTHSWLPTLLDVVGGYNDALDDWLDQTIDKHSASGDDDVGHLALRSLLRAAGEYPLPPQIRDWLVTSRTSGGGDQLAAASLSPNRRQNARAQ